MLGHDEGKARGKTQMDGAVDEETRRLQLEDQETSEAMNAALEAGEGESTGLLEPRSVKHEKSRVWHRVQKSNKRVQRLSWGHNLQCVVKQEQFRQVSWQGQHDRRKQIIDGAFRFVEQRRALAVVRERIFYGAKILLESTLDGSFFNIANPQQDARDVGKGDPSNRASLQGLGPAEPRKRPTHLILTNLSDPTSTAPIHFGDRNDDRALYTAKWKLLDPENLQSSRAEHRSNRVLTHMDHLLLDHNNHLMSSVDPGLIETNIPESTTIWRVHLVSNASIKMVAPAQRVLMRAQTQIQEAREKEDRQRLFSLKIHSECRAFREKSDRQYLMHDPTNLDVHDSAQVLEYYTNQLEKDRLHEFAPLEDATATRDDEHGDAGREEEAGCGNLTRDDDEELLLAAMLPTQVARAGALAASFRAEMQVPGLVWQHVHAQESILLRQMMEKRVAAAVKLQTFFRKWKQERWLRTFHSADLRCLAQIARDAEALRFEILEASPVNPETDDDAAREEDQRELSTEHSCRDFGG
ncbi:Uncharacterized protein SCF082_LOCUS43410, partial [Durusdinium trenchii]